jgi:hypothetical protein
VQEDVRRNNKALLKVEDPVKLQEELIKEEERLEAEKRRHERLKKESEMVAVSPRYQSTVLAELETMAMNLDQECRKLDLQLIELESKG